MKSSTGCLKLTADGMHVIKYFKSEEVYNREIGILERVAGLDPGATFTTPGEPLALAKAPADHLVECPGAVRAIRYMYGGPTIKEIMTGLSDMTDEEVDQLVCAFVRLMLRVIAMNRAGWIHTDAHNENTVYRDGVLRLIDFELMQARPEIFNYFDTFTNDMYYLATQLGRIANKKKTIPRLNELMARLYAIPNSGEYEPILAQYEAALQAAAC